MEIGDVVKLSEYGLDTIYSSAGVYRLKAETWRFVVASLEEYEVVRVA